MVSVLNKTNECTDYATIITDQHYFTENLRVKFILKIHHGGGGVVSQVLIKFDRLY